MTFHVGTVVASYQQGHSIDVLLDNDGSRLSNVQVLAQSASADSGTIDMPSIDGPTDDTRWDPTVERARYIKAIISFIGSVPICVGFLFPQVNQLTFLEKNRRIQRHASDVYSTIDDAGNAELSFPNGTYIRIGTTAAHEDLTGKDFDKKWKEVKNKTKATHLQVTLKNNNVLKFSLHVDPDGNVTMLHTGNLAVVTAGNATVDVSGTTALTSGGAVTVTAPSVTIDSPETTITGALTVGNGITSTGDVTADGVSLEGHTHSGVDAGSDDSGPPN